MLHLACGDFAGFLESDNFIAVLAITLGCGVGMLGIVGGTLTSIHKTRSREQTKRELAAYVAEGTLDPEHAVAMLNSGIPKWETTKMSAEDFGS